MCGGGPNPDDFNKPTEQERAQAEVSAKMFNEYLKGKPIENAYLTDISKDPAIAAKTVQGQASADLAQSAPSFISSPNAGMNIAGMASFAGKRAKIMGDISQNLVSQQAAGRKAFVENAMGIQSTANTAQSGLAAEAVNRNLTNAQSDVQSSNAGNSAVASLAGSGAGMMMSIYNNKNK